MSSIDNVPESIVEKNIVPLDGKVTKDLINKQILSSEKEYTSLDSVFENIIEYLEIQEDINNTLTIEHWKCIFSFVKENINNLNNDNLISYFKLLFNLELKFGLNVLDGKMCHENIIKEYQLLLYNKINKNNNDINNEIPLMFGVYVDLFATITDSQTDEPNDTEKLLFLLDIFKSIISLIISSYKYVIESSYKVILKDFYKIWKVVDLLLVSFNSHLESAQKKNIIISLEYLINKFFNNLIDIDKESEHIDKTIDIFIDLLSEETKDNKLDTTFYLKLIDNYLLFNIDNISKSLIEKVDDGSIEETKFYVLFKYLFEEINSETDESIKEYHHLLTQIVLNYLQTMISNMNLENEDDKAESVAQKTIKCVVTILKLNDFKDSINSEKFYKILLNIVNNFGYTIVNSNIWNEILNFINYNIESSNSKLLLKAVVTNDDILNNLNLDNVQITIDLINKVILNEVNKKNNNNDGNDFTSTSSSSDDNVLLNYFNYFWNINDYLNSFDTENIKSMGENQSNDKTKYYETWKYLFNSLFDIFLQIDDQYENNTLKVSALTIYFNLINNSLAIVNEQEYSDFIKKSMIDDKLLTDNTIISNCLSKNESVLDLVLKELLILVKINHKPFLNFYKNLIELGNTNGNNNILYVLMTNYYKFLEKCLSETTLAKDLKTDLYQIWLSYDFSFNNDTIINEIKINKSESKSQYDLITEYMKIFPLINELLLKGENNEFDYTDTNLKIIDKCLKFPILPNNNGKDENNMTILQRCCLENMKLMLQNNTTNILSVLEKISDIIHYKTVVKDLINEKIFTKLPEKLNNRLPTFKKVSYEALLVLNDNCNDSQNSSDVIVQNLLETINKKDTAKSTVKDSKPMWILACEIISRLLILEKENNRKILLQIFDIIMEDTEQNEDSIVSLYKQYSPIFFKNIPFLKTETKEFNKICCSIVKITVKKELLPIYQIFSSKLLINEVFELKEFDEENLWLLISDYNCDESSKLKYETLPFLVTRDLKNNMDQIQTNTDEDDKFLKLLNLNSELNLKYYPLKIKERENNKVIEL